MERSKVRAAALFNSLPRNIRDVPLIDALVGANGTDLLDAIFDVDVDEEHLEPLFSDDDYFDRAQLLTQQSIQSDPGRSRAASVINIGKEPPTAPTQLNPDALRVPPPLPSPRMPRSPLVASGSGGAVITPSGDAGQNRLRKRSQTPVTRPHSMGHALVTYEEEQTNYQSPLARLFSSAARRPPRPIDFAPSQVPVEETLIGIKRLEGMVEGLKEDKGAVTKIRSEMKELQVRVNTVWPICKLMAPCMAANRNAKPELRLC